MNRPDTVVDLLDADEGLLERIANEQQRFFRRMVSVLVTRVTMKCPGYSTGGRVPMYSRGEAR